LKGVTPDLSTGFINPGSERGPLDDPRSVFIFKFCMWVEIGGWGGTGGVREDRLTFEYPDPETDAEDGKESLP
jgi:hypothetical protein